MWLWSMIKVKLHPLSLLPLHLTPFLPILVRGIACAFLSIPYLKHKIADQIPYD